MTRTRTVYGAVNPNEEQDRERAAEARHGGNEYRRAFAAGDARWAAAVGKVYGGNGALIGRDMSHPALPESAFDWPIYRAAMESGLADTRAAIVDSSAADEWIEPLPEEPR